jgi:hypothetical protein
MWVVVIAVLINGVFETGIASQEGKQMTFLTFAKCENVRQIIEEKKPDVMVGNSVCLMLVSKQKS